MTSEEQFDEWELEQLYHGAGLTTEEVWQAAFAAGRKDRQEQGAKICDSVENRWSICVDEIRRTE
jgi:hypothetical protein